MLPPEHVAKLERILRKKTKKEIAKKERGLPCGTRFKILFTAGGKVS